MSYRIGETCAGCGKEIGMLEGSYYRKGPNDDIGKSYHSFCGDPFDIAAKVAAEREACAQIALAIDSGRGNEKEIARAIRARAAVTTGDRADG